MAKKMVINKAFVEAYLKDENGYPETGFFKEQKDLQKFYKQCTDEQLAEWVGVEGLEFKPNESAPINRMRMAMAILYYHFPKESATKKKSKYADYTNEQLIQMVLDNDVPVEVTDDERIMRMRAIMALRAHKIIE
jgi:hypothetical protein